MKPTAGSGSAPIVMVGHTSNGRNGSDAGKRVVPEAKPREHELKTSKG